MDWRLAMTRRPFRANHRVDYTLKWSFGAEFHGSRSARNDIIAARMAERLGVQTSNSLLNSTGQTFSWWAAVLTVSVGFVPFLVLSVLSDTFWPHSRVAVPLTLSPSILIGDSLLIPIFNGLAFPIIKRLIGQPTSVRGHVIILAATGFLLSTATNLFLHVMWTRDEYTGFIDPTRGKLSFGGEWHFAFATMELFLVLAFVAVCYWYGNVAVVGQVLRAWRIFVIYSTMSIWDAVVMFTVVGRPVRELGVADYIALSPPILAIVVYRLLGSSRRVKQSTPKRADSVRSSQPESEEQ
jgi:hypothetical protein